MSLRHKTLATAAFVIMVMTPVAALPAYAASSTTTSQPNFFQGLVQFIAQKFGLDQTQVQSAVKDYQSQQKQTMQQNMVNKNKSRLDSLVSSGKITASQEQQILDEQNTLRSKYNPANFKNETSDQRKTQFQQEQADIKAWSQSTGIDAEYLMPGFGMGMGMRGGMRHWGGVQPTATPTP